MPDDSALYRTPEGYTAVMTCYAAALKRLPVPYESLIVPTCFGETHVIATGPKDAPPLVLLRGMGANAMLWRPQLSALSQAYRATRLIPLDGPNRCCG